MESDVGACTERRPRVCASFTEGIGVIARTQLVETTTCQVTPTSSDLRSKTLCAFVHSPQHMSRLAKRRSRLSCRQHPIDIAPRRSGAMTNFTFRRTRRVAVGRSHRNGDRVDVAGHDVTSAPARWVMSSSGGFCFPRVHRRRATTGLCAGDVPRSGQACIAVPSRSRVLSMLQRLNLRPSA